MFKLLETAYEIFFNSMREPKIPKRAIIASSCGPLNRMLTPKRRGKRQKINIILH